MLAETASFLRSLPRQVTRAFAFLSNQLGAVDLVAWRDIVRAGRAAAERAGA